MPRFRTLTQRFGALYALVIAILISLSIVVTVQLRTIRINSERLVEESREQTEVAQLISELDSLELLLSQTGLDSSIARLRGLDLLASAHAWAQSLNSREDDPSRIEHQREESLLGKQIEEELNRVDLAFQESADRETRDRASLSLVQARSGALGVLDHARDEVREANRDLQGHARVARSVLIGSLVSAVLLLGLALRQTERKVVHPLRRLTQGTDRLRRGERDHRIQLDRADEIGQLAQAFNAMADQLSESQTDLEMRVRKRTQDFIRAARLADLGVLASGIAHEMNTPLASIASSAEGLQRRADAKQITPELLADYTQVITTETARAREITTRMLGLVRQDPGEIARVPLALVAKQAVAALRHRAEGKQVSLACAPVDEGVHVLANAGEIVQMIVNLLANAIDASSPGGTVEMNTWVDGSRFYLEVSDRGHGIPEAKLDSIFDPFYTTKNSGEGTGLGLALVATMVEFRGGTISVHSHVGSGTVFQVDLPSDWSPRR